MAETGNYGNRVVQSTIVNGGITINVGPGAQTSAADETSDEQMGENADIRRDQETVLEFYARTYGSAKGDSEWAKVVREYTRVVRKFGIQPNTFEFSDPKRDAQLWGVNGKCDPREIRMLLSGDARSDPRCGRFSLLVTSNRVGSKIARSAARLREMLVNFAEHEDVAMHEEMFSGGKLDHEKTTAPVVDCKRMSVPGIARAGVITVRMGEEQDPMCDFMWMLLKPAADMRVFRIKNIPSAEAWAQSAITMKLGGFDFGVGFEPVRGLDQRTFFLGRETLDESIRQLWVLLGLQEGDWDGMFRFGVAIHDPRGETTDPVRIPGAWVICYHGELAKILYEARSGRRHTDDDS